MKYQSIKADAAERRYPVSLQQAAAAIFGISVIDGDYKPDTKRPLGAPQQQG